jgi:phage tail-like protein
MGSAAMFQWFDRIRGGQDEVRTVRIELRGEEGCETVQTWVLHNARVIKLSSGPLNARSSEIAMEELTLSYERMEIE